MKKTLRMRFENVREIRMGSPFKVCELGLEGPWVPDLPRHDWQDLAARSPDGRRVALVRWNTGGNIPGFHVVRIDLDRRTVHTTRRIRGLCRRLAWEDGRFVWEK